MARTTLTVHSAGISGITVTGNTTAGTADGHDFTNTGNVWLYVANGSGAATRDLTIVGNGETSGGADYADEVVTVGISSSMIIGPFETAPFNTSGKVQLDFPAGNESDLSVYAFKCNSVS